MLSFSAPLGKRFHTRKIISERLEYPCEVKKFWTLLNLIKKYNIKLELVLNSNHLNEEDIFNAAKIFSKRDISLDKVCFIDKYYNAVNKYFDDIIYKVYSFNNFACKGNDFLDNLSKYNGFILGRDFIRDYPIFSKLKKAHKETTLLLNNGCSFKCPGCFYGNGICEKIFDEHLKNNDINYLYALQSILPEDIHNNWIDLSNIDYYKLNTRSNNVRFCSECLDSYIHNLTQKIVNNSCEYYFFWARLSRFCIHRSELNYNKIIGYKKTITCSKKS